jgi:hypothetical protein
MILNIDHAGLVDLAEAFEAAPSDVQIVDALVEAFELAPAQIIERLICMDFVTVRREVAP